MSTDRKPMTKAEHEALVDEKRILSIKKTELTDMLLKFGLTKSVLKKASHISQPDLIEKRNSIVSEITGIDTRLSFIRNRFRESEDAIEEMERNVLREILGSQFLKEVQEEAERRFYGEAPTKVSLPQMKKTPVKTYRQELSEAIDLLIKARNAITRYVMDNEPEINKADYLQKVKAINQCLPSVSELEKMKPIN